MAENEAGSVSLGFKLNAGDFEKDLKDLSAKAAETMQQAFSGIKAGVGNIDLSAITGSLKTLSTESLKAFDGFGEQMRSEFNTLTESVKSIAPSIEKSLQESIKSGMEQGGTQGTAAIKAAAGKVTIPKIKAELDVNALQQSLIAVEGESNLIHERIKQIAPRIDELSQQWSNLNRIQQGSTPQAQKLQDQIYRTQKEMQGLEDAAQQAAIRASAIEQEMIRVKSAASQIAPEMEGLKAVSQATEGKFKAITAAADQMISKNKEAAAAMAGVSSEPIKQAVYSFNLLGERIKATSSDMIVMFERGTIGTDQFGKGMKSLGFDADYLKDRFGIAFDEAEKGAKGAKDGVKGVSREMSKASKGASSLGQGFKKLAKMGLMALGVRSLYMGIRKAVNLASESIGHMANQNAAFGNVMNGLTQSFSTFKASIGAAVAPLITALAPALQKVAQWATNAMNAVAIFFAKLTGQKSVQIAVGSTEQFTKATDKSAKAAKKATKEQEKLKRSLAGFDELEILSFGDTSGAEDSSPDVDSSEAQAAAPIFKTLALESTNLKDRLGELWASLSNSKAFQTLATAAETAFNHIQTKASQAGQRISESWAANMPSIVESTRSILSNVGEIFANIFSYITIPHFAGFVGASLDIGAAIIDNLLSVGASLLGLVDTMFAPFAESINEFFDEHGISISDLIYSTWETIGEGVSGILDGIGEIYRSVFGGLTEWFSENGEEIKTMFTETWETAWGIIEPIWNGIKDTAETVFGAIKDFLYEVAPQIRDVIVSAVDLAWTIIKPIWQAMLAVAKVIFGALKQFWDKWGGDISAGFSLVWSGIKTVFSTVLNTISGIFKIFKAIFTGDWEGAWEGIKEVAAGLWSGLTEGFGSMLDGISKIFSFLGEDVAQIFDGIKQIFSGAVEFITGVFTGDWERAWNGVKEIFSGIWESLKGIVKAPMNFIIDGVNKMIKGINKVKIPDWVPLIGGKGFSIPEIPRLARGGIVDQPTVAMVGEAGTEAVMPLERNTGWIDMLAQKLKEYGGGGGGGGDIYLTTTVVLDSGEIVEVIEQKIDRNARQGNKPAFA